MVLAQDIWCLHRAASFEPRGHGFSPNRLTLHYLTGPAFEHQTAARSASRSRRGRPSPTAHPGQVGSPQLAFMGETAPADPWGLKTRTATRMRRPAGGASPV